MITRGKNTHSGTINTLKRLFFKTKPQDQLGEEGLSQDQLNQLQKAKAKRLSGKSYDAFDNQRKTNYERVKISNDCPARELD